MAKRKRRRFTPEFKTEIVLEALRGESSQAELCRRHNLSEGQLSKWKQQVGESTPHPTADLETVRASITPKCAGDTSFGSRRAVPFKSLSLNAHTAWR